MILMASDHDLNKGRSAAVFGRILCIKFTNTNKPVLCCEALQTAEW